MAFYSAGLEFGLPSREVALSLTMNSLPSWSEKWLLNARLERCIPPKILAKVLSTAFKKRLKITYILVKYIVVKKKYVPI